MTNCSRTLDQNLSSGLAGVGGSLSALGHARLGVTNGTAPLNASSRAKSRRFMRPPEVRLKADATYHRIGLDSTPIVEDTVAEDDGAVHGDAEGDERDGRGPERQPPAPEPTGVAVHQLDWAARRSSSTGSTSSWCTATPVGSGAGGCRTPARRGSSR